MKNREFGNKLLKTLFKNKEVISVNIVGSFFEKQSIEKIGDLDIVVVCKKISKKIFNSLSIQLLKINNLKLIKQKIIINSTFGPIKITKKNHLPIHLMIYDVKSHTEHVITSPFTCYDWERSNWNLGLKLKEIFPVKGLQFNDFIKARRNSKEYLKELQKKVISIRGYFFKRKNIYLKKRYISIDDRNRGEFAYHIVNFLIINLHKFLIGENIKISEREFVKLFLKITNNDKKLLNKYLFLKKQKKESAKFYSQNIILFGKIFINKYEKFIENYSKNLTNITFVRHQKTKLNKTNIFLGSRSDPDIIKANYKRDIKKKYDLIITSNLKRSISTSKYFHYKKKISTELLNEIDYGKAEGLSYKLLKKKYPQIIKKWSNGKDVKFPGGENTNDVKKRVIKFIKFLNKYKNKKNILIITHSFFLRVIIGLQLKFNLAEIHKLKIQHLKEYNFIKSKNRFLTNFNRNDIKDFYKQIYD
tara:strand:- start:130 stop:1551 length:1422 start_codon:yes stop_codon:yes gene_type:complete